MSDPSTDEIQMPDLATAAAAARARDAVQVPRPQRIGFFPRVGAALIDVLCLVPLMAIYVASYVYLEEKGRLTPAMDYVMTIVAALFGLVYTSPEVFFAATPGKMILRQRIARADGTAADGWVLLNRWLYKNGGAILGLIAAITTVELVDLLGNLWGLVIGIGCLFVFQESRQAFHDRWARTAVYPRQVITHRGFEPLSVGQAPAAMVVADRDQWST